jgi:histidyl-tRNA synthetase
METQPARGMRDFLPDDVRRREHVVGVIRDVYDRYGFEPLETPAAENIETLLGKYGEEGNKLIFKILKRGDHGGQADLALRYDLTVPLARVVAEYQATLPKFFKRYQIQPVWRADRPARGRFREFYQCDIDSIGSVSPVVEAEQIAAVSEILTVLGFKDFVIRLNHRGVLTGMLTASGVPGPLHGETLTALDKRDKIGEDGVELELKQRGLDQSTIVRLLAITAFLPAAVDPFDELNTLEEKIGEDPVGASALSNLREIFHLSTSTGAGHLILDKSLARGLSYYTGAIMEVGVRDLPGSLGGGGRYDNLIGMFSGDNVPACGFSLGLERILVVMQEREMFPAFIERSSIDVIVAAIDSTAQVVMMETAASLRTLPRLRVDVYPEVARKMDKLFRHVDQRKARFLAIVGGNEVADGTVSIRDVATRKQETIPRGALAGYLSSRLTTND